MDGDFNMIRCLSLLAGLIISLSSWADSAISLTDRIITTTQGQSLEFQAFCYHDVEDPGTPMDKMASDSVDLDEFVQQMTWMKHNGYTFLKVDDLVNAANTGKLLPPKSVLVTFDDGYKSFYNKIFPVAKELKIPVVLGLVGSWLETKEGEKVQYGSDLYSRELFITWEEAKEMSDSGLIEMANHSFDSHKGVLANPQGNTEPAFTARIYNKDSNTYESDSDYLIRVKQDLIKNQSLIKSKLGKNPRIMVWPFGRYNGISKEIAKSLGMTLMFTLNDGKSLATKSGLEEINRYYVRMNPSLPEFVFDFSSDWKAPIRVMHVDMDYVYDKDEAQMNKNLSKLLDRVQEAGVNTVFLQAFSDPEGNGNVKEVYFPNRHLPVKADLFNRVAWQLATRTRVKVFAWLPVTGFTLPTENPVGLKKVQSIKETAKGTYPRLSVFSPEVRKVVKEIYDDLGKSSPISGILFHDDATLNDFEDSSPDALAVYKSWGFPADIAEIRKDKAMLSKWSKQKSKYITDFTLELVTELQKYQPKLKTARNIYAQVVLNPDSEEWFAQNLENMASSYDYVAVMAMPWMEKASDPSSWLVNLAKLTRDSLPGKESKILFELQATDWNNSTEISAETLRDQMRLIQRNGILNFGYYPDNFIKDSPNLSILKRGISLRDYPRK